MHMLCHAMQICVLPTLYLVNFYLVNFYSVNFYLVFSEFYCNSTQVAFALEYLHKHKILHRDVKTHNIFMIKSGLVKLGDFGISVALR